MGCPHITYWFICFYLFSVVCQDLECIYGSIDSHKNLQTQFKCCNVWTLLCANLSVQYFGSYHLPYAILALVLLFFFVIVPNVILLLYPFQFFQKILILFSINWYSLRIYVDSFLGCYKDGTEPGTFDCRWFSALMLFTRPICFIIYGLTLSVITFAYALIFNATVLILFVNIHPYKKTTVRYPSTDTTFLS